MVGGCLRHSDHKMMKVLHSLRNKDRVIRIATLDFGKAEFGLFGSLVDCLQRQSRRAKELNSLGGW